VSLADDLSFRGAQFWRKFAVHIRRGKNLLLRITGVIG
jgi:hypothetical protein